MTIVLSTPPYQQFFDDNGNPLAGGLVYTYLAGTLTPRATYTDQGGITPSANPIVLDSAGRTQFWLDNSAAYKFIVKTSAGVTVSNGTADNVTPFSTSTGLAVLGSIAANTIVGNNTGAPATPTALTTTQVQALISSPIYAAWLGYTPTITHSSGGATNVTTLGKWRRIGDSIEIKTESMFSGVSAAFASWLISIPSGLTIDISKLPGAIFADLNLGSALLTDTGVNTYIGIVRFNSTTTFALTVGVASGTYLTVGDISNTAPFTFGAGDSLSTNILLPILEYA